MCCPQLPVVFIFSTCGRGEQHIAVAQPDLKQNSSFHIKKNNNNKNNNPTALAAHIQLYFGPWFP